MVPDFDSDDKVPRDEKVRDSWYLAPRVSRESGGPEADVTHVPRRVRNRLRLRMVRVADGGSSAESNATVGAETSRQPSYMAHG